MRTERVRDFQEEVERQSARAHSATDADGSAEGLLALTVCVVDETCVMPVIEGSTYHGIVHELLLAPTKLGADLVAQCRRAMPRLPRRGSRWCLCWGEQAKGGFGKPGKPIDLQMQGIKRMRGWSDHTWTLADAGIETHDVLWLRHMAVRQALQTPRRKVKSLKMQCLTAEAFGIPHYAKPYARDLIPRWYPGAHPCVGLQLGRSEATPTPVDHPSNESTPMSTRTSTPVK